MLFSTVGIPIIKWCGTEGDYNVLVMELLGPSLEDLFNFCNRKFSIKTVLLLADQMVSGRGLHTALHVCEHHCSSAVLCIEVSQVLPLLTGKATVWAEGYKIEF